MVAGIVLFAFAMKKTLADVDGELATIPALGLCGGPALYLFAYVALRVRVSRTLGRGRLIAAIACALLWPVAVGGAGARRPHTGGGRLGRTSRIRDHLVARRPRTNTRRPSTGLLTPTGSRNCRKWWPKQIGRPVVAPPDTVHDGGLMRPLRLSACLISLALLGAAAAGAEARTPAQAEPTSPATGSSCAPAPGQRTGSGSCSAPSRCPAHATSPTDLPPRRATRTGATSAAPASRSTPAPRRQCQRPRGLARSRCDLLGREPGVEHPPLRAMRQLAGGAVELLLGRLPPPNEAATACRCSSPSAE